MVLFIVALAAAVGGDSVEVSVIESLNALANSITVFGLGALIIAALVRRWVVTRATFEQIVGILQARIAELTKERDDALAGWRTQTEATTRLAEAVEQSNRDAAARHRYSDAERRT